MIARGLGATNPGGPCYGGPPLLATENAGLQGCFLPF